MKWHRDSDGLHKRPFARAVRWLIVALVAILVGGGVYAGRFVWPPFPDPADANVKLEDVERFVARRFRVGELAPLELRNRQGDQRIVLIDVRTPSEFAESRIEGAIRVDPGISAQEFLLKFGEHIKGATVVFYCSVGVRSSQLLRSVEQSAKSFQPVALYNLRGGIFRWHAAGLPMVDERGRAEQVHPFDVRWGLLLDRTVPNFR